MLLFHGNGRGGQLFDGLIELALDLQQAVALVAAGLELALDFAELLPQSLQLGQGGGGDCRTMGKLITTSSRQQPDCGGRQELTFELGNAGLLGLLVASQFGDLLLEGPEGCEQPVEDGLPSLTYVLQKTQVNTQQDKKIRTDCEQSARISGTTPRGCASAPPQEDRDTYQERVVGGR